ncbi:MAG: hypothetical protein ACTH2Q_18255, partial [Propionibacteriaceae bacterium]
MISPPTRQIITATASTRSFPRSPERVEATASVAGCVELGAAGLGAAGLEVGADGLEAGEVGVDGGAVGGVGGGCSAGYPLITGVSGGGSDTDGSCSGDGYASHGSSERFQGSLARFQGSFDRFVMTWVAGRRAGRS